mgnify:CR=1 FL=1
MQLKDFEYVLKIAETHNLSRAAEELFIAQSTLSHALNRIEAEVGAPLSLYPAKYILKKPGKF